MPYSHNTGYNYDFNDQDARMLVDFAGRPPAQQPYTCGWIVGGMLCNTPVFGHCFSAHLRDYHGITGHDKAKFWCGWMGCGVQMNKESIVRHVMEMHLQMRHPCPHCPEVFSRKHTLNDHMKKHYVQ